MAEKVIFKRKKEKERKGEREKEMFTPNQKQQQKQRQIELAADKVFEESTVEEVRSKISAAHKDITNRTREINVYIGKHHNELVNVTDAVIKLADTTSVLQKEVCASEKVQT